MIRLLGQLHSADALLADVTPDSMEVFRRHERQQRAEWRRRLWTPLALRFPIFDPDRFLERTLPFVQPLFGWFGALLWLAVVGAGAVLAAVHWTDLTKDVVDRGPCAAEPAPAVARLPGGQGAARARSRLTPPASGAARCTRSASCCWC